MYVYISCKHGEPATVGFYDPSGTWIPESDHATNEEAAARVHWLNGGQTGATSAPASAEWPERESQ